MTETTLSDMMASIYPQLLVKAAYYLTRERPGHPLDPAALANESFIRMMKRSGEVWRDEAHLFSAASLEMRRVLIEHFRASKASKRWGQMVQVPWDDGLAVGTAFTELAMVLAVRELLIRLEKLEPQMVEIIELRYFGYTVEEISDQLQVSKSTVKLKLKNAFAWLRGHLESDVNRRNGLVGETSGIESDTEIARNGASEERVHIRHQVGAFFRKKPAPVKEMAGTTAR